MSVFSVGLLLVVCCLVFGVGCLLLVVSCGNFVDGSWLLVIWLFGCLLAACLHVARCLLRVAWCIL